MVVEVETGAGLTVVVVDKGSGVITVAILHFTSQHFIINKVYLYLNYNNMHILGQFMLHANIFTTVKLKRQ